MPGSRARWVYKPLVSQLESAFTFDGRAIDDEFALPRVSEPEMMPSLHERRSRLWRDTIQTSRSVKMNRRELLGAGAVVMGATAAGIAFEPTAKAETHTGTVSVETGTRPNYTPPIIQVDGGQLRDGKTTVFLGIPYAEAERFELPKPVQPREGVKSAQS
jgi:hypothetical protein